MKKEIKEKKRNIAKNTLSFTCSKAMKFIRTPPDIWKIVKEKMDYHGIKLTIDVCASDINHLLPRYYTEKENGLEKNWDGEVVWCHPMFDSKIGKWVERAFNSKAIVVMLLPAATHTRYFHRFIYKNPKCQVEFLEKPVRGWDFGTEEGQFEIPKGKVGYIKPLMIVVFNNLANKT